QAGVGDLGRAVRAGQRAQLAGDARPGGRLPRRREGRPGRGAGADAGRGSGAIAGVGVERHPGRAGQDHPEVRGVGRIDGGGGAAGRTATDRGGAGSGRRTGRDGKHRGCNQGENTSRAHWGQLRGTKSDHRVTRCSEYATGRTGGFPCSQRAANVPRWTERRCRSRQPRGATSGSRESVMRKSARAATIAALVTSSLSAVPALADTEYVLTPPTIDWRLVVI